MSVLLVAATERELCGHAGLACGIGPVEAAAATARALAEQAPDAVLHVGLAGGVGLEPGSLVVGTESVYADLAAAIPVLSRVEPDARLLAAIREAFPDAPALPIATSAAVSGPSYNLSQGLLVEAMEGFGVLAGLRARRVPAVEVRAISNELGEPDRSRWELERGLAALEERAAAPARRRTRVAFAAWRGRERDRRSARCRRRFRRRSAPSASSSRRRFATTASTSSARCRSASSWRPSTRSRSVPPASPPRSCCSPPARCSRSRTPGRRGW